MRSVPTVLAISSGLSLREQLSRARDNSLMEQQVFKRDQYLRAAAAESMARIRRQDRANALNNVLKAVSADAARAGRISVQSELPVGTVQIMTRDQLMELLS